MSSPYPTHLAALFLLLFFITWPRGDAPASHFSWLGHSECPGGPSACEKFVPSGFTALGQFKLSHYKVLDEAADQWRTEPKEAMLLSRDGHVIAHVGRKFKAKLEEEGTARLLDGRMVNAEEKVGGQWRYLVIQDAPFGIGAPGYKLMPYRTISVDPKRIPLGTVLYIPALIGFPLPNSEMHDGFVFAHDMNEEHAVDSTIQLFLGFDDRAATRLQQAAMKRHVKVYRADQDTSKVLNRRFKAQFDWSG